MQRVSRSTDAREAGHSLLLLSVWANAWQTPVPSLHWLVINSLQRTLKDKIWAWRHLVGLPYQWHLSSSENRMDETEYMNSKMLKDAYVCTFKASWRLFSKFAFWYSCSRASPCSVSLGEALLNTSFTAATSGSPHSHCTPDKPWVTGEL